MLITVTQDDIRLGKKNTVDNCPIALSFRREFPNCEITVFSRKVTVNRNNIITTYYPTVLSAAVLFISSFDSGKPVNPFSLEYYVKL